MEPKRSVASTVSLLTDDVADERLSFRSGSEKIQGVREGEIYNGQSLWRKGGNVGRSCMQVGRQGENRRRKVESWEKYG